MTIHVSLEFAQYTPAQVFGFGTNVANSLTKSAAIFDKPPVTVAALQAELKILGDAVAIAPVGSVADRAKRDQSADVVIGMLRQLAAYVEDVAKGDEPTIDLSGFLVVHRGGPNPRQPLDKTGIQEIKNEVSGQLLVRLNSQSNANGYDGQISTDSGKTWQPLGYFPQARRIVVPNLTPGTTYTFRFRALGGSTGSGDWSDPVSHMSL